MNVVHPMETNDPGTVDDGTGAIIRGPELDDEFYRRILPPKTQLPSRQPQKQHIES